MGESETLRDEDRDSETKTCIETGGQEEERPKDSPRKIWNVTGSQKEPEKERETQDLLMRQPLRDFQR